MDMNKHNINETEITREYLLELLHNNEINITFEKKDGTIREMKCTLQEDLLPKRAITEEKKEPKKVNEEVIAVYDLEKQAFRSFRIDSLKSFGFSI